MVLTCNVRAMKHSSAFLASFLYNGLLMKLVRSGFSGFAALKIRKWVEGPQYRILLCYQNCNEALLSDYKCNRTLLSDLRRKNPTSDRHNQLSKRQFKGPHLSAVQATPTYMYMASGTTCSLSFTFGQHLT